MAKNHPKIFACGFIDYYKYLFFSPWEYAFYYLKPLPGNLKTQTNEAIQQGLDGIIVYVQKPMSLLNYMQTAGITKQKRYRLMAQRYLK